MEQWVKRESVFNGRIFKVEAGEAVLEDGRLVPREVVTHEGGVAVVPLLGDEVLLVRQFRISVGEFLLELPAGRREGLEPPDHRAALELEEETGYRAADLRLLITYYSSPGFTDERMHIYLARDLTEVGQSLESDENIELVRVPLADLADFLAGGNIVDAKTIIGLRELLARPHLWPPQAG